MLEHLLPVEAGKSPETLRGHTLKVGEQLGNAAAVRPAAAASTITVTVDSTFIRSCHDGERHLEVRVGNVEMPDGARQVFGAVARTDTDIALLIRRNLETVGRIDGTELTAFTDGCPGLRSILADAGIANPPIADWFHIAMRLQHAKQAAIGLSTDEPGRMQAKTVIVAEVERLRWRIWNGKAKNARCSIDRIRKVMHVFKGEHGHRRTGVPSRKLWAALHEVDGYLNSQSNWLVNYAKRYRAGLRGGTSVTEGTANFLVNRRMNKSQQMRWSEEVPIFCSRFAVRSTTACSARGSATCLSRPPAQTHNWQRQRDPPSFWTLPTSPRTRRASGRFDEKPEAEVFRTRLVWRSPGIPVGLRLVPTPHGPSVRGRPRLHTC